MGLLDGLFSSGDSSSSSSSSKISAQTNLTKQMINIFGSDIKALSGIQAQIDKLTKRGQPIPAELQASYDELKASIGPNVYQGDRVAPLSDIQQNTIDAAGNLTGAFSTTADPSTMPLFDETGQAIKGLLAGGPQGATDFTGGKQFTPEDTAAYFKGSIYDPTMKSLTQDVNPATQEAFAGPGFYGAARSQALQKNATDTADTLNAARTTLDWNVLGMNQNLAETAANRRVSSQDTAAARSLAATTAGVNQGMAYSQLPAQQIKDNMAIAASKVAGLKDIFGFGAAEQTQEQAQLTADMTKFMEENQIMDPALQEMLFNLLGQNFSKSSSSGGTTEGGLSGLDSGLIAAAAALI